MPNQTLERIQKLRVDALYGKKKHFNAADRKRVYQSGVSVAVHTGAIYSYYHHSYGQTTSDHPQ